MFFFEAVKEGSLGFISRGTKFFNITGGVGVHLQSINGGYGVIRGAVEAN